MSNCTQIRAEILDKLDTPLMLENSALLQNHLKSCEECSNFLKELLLIQNTIKDLPKLETSKSFEERLKKQLEQEKGQGKIISFNAHTKKMVWTKLFAYTAGVAIMALGFVALQQNSDNNKENFSPFINNQAVATKQMPAQQSLVAQKSKDDSIKHKATLPDSLKEFKVHSNIEDNMYRVDYTK